MNRFLAFLGVLFIAVFAGMSLWAAAPTDVSTATINARRLGGYTVNTGYLASTTTVWVQQLDVADDIGWGTNRTNTDMWDVIEASSGVFTYTKMNDTIDLIKSYGMDVIFTSPYNGSWPPDNQFCTATNPFSLTALSPTHCVTSDMGLVKRLHTNVATEFCDDIDIWEIGNEPDLLFGSTNPAVYVAFATNAIAGITAGCPSAATNIWLPALASPKATVVNANVTDGLTMYNERHWFADMLGKLEPALPAELTLSSFTYSIHVYLTAAGGGQTFSVVTSTISAMLANHGVSSPKLAFSEYNDFGGSSSDSAATRDLKVSSATLKYMAQTMSSTSPVIKRIIFHNESGNDFSATDTDLTYRYAAKTQKAAISALNGATAQGDTGAGNLQAYKFTQPDGDLVYLTWCNTASCTWSLSPLPLAVRKTDVYGVPSVIGGSNFSSFSVGQEPGLYELVDVGTTLQGRITLQGNLTIK